MIDEGDLIAPVLLNGTDGTDRCVDELCLDDHSIAILEGLIESKSKEEQISPEDLAWVDSCLMVDPELSMESWASLKEALLDSMTTFADSYEENNAADLDEAGNGEQMEVEKEEVLSKPDIVNDQEDPALVRARNDGNDDRNDGEEEVQKELETPDVIFRVWDLHEDYEEKEHELIPELTRAATDLQVVKEEEDELITELKQAVAESILREKQRVATDKAITAEDGTLDELISSMGDLSLIHPPSKFF